MMRRKLSISGTSPANILKPIIRSKTENNIPIPLINQRPTKARMRVIRQRFKILVRTMIIAGGTRKYNSKTGNEVYDTIMGNLDTTEDTAASVANTIAPKLVVTIDRPSFSVEDYISSSSQSQVTDYVLDHILCKPGESRTEVDLQVLDRIVSNMPYFQLYAKFPSVRREISRNLEYRIYLHRRRILQQGHKPVFVYFIVKGSVCMKHKDEKDSKLNWTKIINEGSSFGDYEVRLDVLRPASVFVESDDVLLLCMDADSFRKIIVSFKDHLLLENKKIIKEIPILKKLNESAQDVLAECSLIKDFHTNTILKQYECFPESIYFIVSGRVKLCKSVGVKKKATMNNKKHKIEFDLNSQNTDNYLLLKTESLTKGHFFGDESVFFVPVLPDRKTCMREHFKYPLRVSSLGERLDIVFEGTNSAEEQNLSFTNYDSALKAMDEELMSQKLDTSLFRKNLFSIIPDDKVQCLLVPKVKLLRVLSDELFEELKSKSFFTNTFRIMDILGLRGRDDSRKKKALGISVTSFASNHGMPFLQKDPFGGKLDMFEMQVDKALWHSYLIQQHWQTYKKECQEKLIEQKRTKKNGI